MSRWKSSAALTVAAVAVFGLTACGSKDAPSTTEQQQPSGLALLASDAKGSLQKTADTAGKTTSLTLTMEGKQDGDAVKGSGQVVLGAERKAEVTIEDPKDGPTTVRVIGTAFYVQVPPADQADMDGKKWLKLDASAGDAGADSFAGLIDDIDPAVQIKPLLGAETITVVGEEAVNGVQTVHYTIVMPTAPYLAALPETVRAETEKQLTKLAVKEVKTELWIDEQYQVRRGRTFMNDANDIIVNFTDFNKPVTVDVPPAAETADFAELLKGIQG
ncbi:hypothetical protein OG792_17915 [Micromonospora sp. NBC_01699]|uniref:hypothetical protein n=1 Tax=Micromonospora sp. NBC_01699 TaxID=2975984 RepID=UPI002E351DDD|nr:hypothetical protein [Micromonospora sp. NBC_01699]